MSAPRVCGPFDVVGNCQRCGQPLARFCQECRLQQRRAMRPGQIFGVVYPTDPLGYVPPQRGAFVVVDRTSEVEFFTGGRSTFGDVAPSVEFEVLS